LIQGVHAQSVIFMGLEPLEALFQRGLWPGPQGYSSSTELSFTGSRPGRFTVRMGGLRCTSKTASCSWQLEAPSEPFKPKLRGSLEFSQAATRMRTKVMLQGMVERDLIGAAMATDEVRSVANEYARQLLEGIARHLEDLVARQTMASSARSAPGS
jgi:hypothetical protein